MDVLWQGVVLYSTRPLEVALISKETYFFVSGSDLARAVARRILIEDYPRLKRARSTWGRACHAKDSNKKGPLRYYHPNVLVAYINGYLPPGHPHPQVIRHLVRFGCRHLDTALEAAIRRGLPDICDALIASGANVNSNDSSPLRLAARHGEASSIRILLSHGANVNARGGEPLIKAATHGHGDAVRALLDGGADVDCRWGKPLLAACAQRNISALRILLDAGAKVNYTRALATAFHYRETGPLETFLNYGRWESERDIKTAMDFAVRWCAPRHADLILRRYGTDFEDDDYVRWLLAIWGPIGTDRQSEMHRLLTKYRREDKSSWSGPLYAFLSGLVPS